MKDTIIIFVILIIILSGAIYTYKYLDKTTGELSNNLEDLKEEIKIAMETENRDKIRGRVNDIYQKWEKTESNWAIIVLHDELDQIETSFTKMKSEIEDGELEKSLEELETSVFLVNHIKEKEKFCLKNIL